MVSLTCLRGLDVAELKESDIPIFYLDKGYKKLNKNVYHFSKKKLLCNTDQLVH